MFVFLISITIRITSTHKAVQKAEMITGVTQMSPFVHVNAWERVAEGDWTEELETRSRLKTQRRC